MTAALVTVVALALPADASIGIRHDTLRNYQATLESLGWKVRTGKAWTTADVNQLIDEVLEKFSKEEAGKVTAETKREVARIAEEAIEENTLKTGSVGPLHYRVGIFRYKSYELERSGRMMGIEEGRAPLIALILREPARLMEARIYVYNVPEDAELFFDGDATAQKGRYRSFTTPALEVGKMYSYKALIRWQKDGKKYERSCTVPMTGGDYVRVNFSSENGVPGGPRVERPDE